MKSHFRLQVSFADFPPVAGVLEVLPLCLWGVETTLKLFEPVFSHGQPPLPANAALAMEDAYHGQVLRHLAELGFPISRDALEPEDFE
jgi:hypothetical protein